MNIFSDLIKGEESHNLHIISAYVKKLQRFLFRHGLRPKREDIDVRINCQWERESTL